MRSFTLAVFCLQLLPSSTVMESVVPDEQRLYSAIMSRYNADVRPVSDVNDTVIVEISLRLDKIIDLKWVDLSLAWDPLIYNNLQSIRIPSAKVWLPDTFMFNNADEGSTGFINGKYVLVDYNGKVTWPVPLKLKSTCKVDISYFPFDDQICALKFGSWVYSRRWVDFIPTENLTSVDLSKYVNNSEWDLLLVSRKKDMKIHAYSSEPHAHITFRLYIRRRTFYYIFNVIVPCMMLSLLTMLTFWLPPVSSEKVTLGLSVFLAFSMFMLLIAQEVPTTSESVPLIGIYLCVVTSMTSASVIMAVMVVNLYNPGVKRSRAPACLRIAALKWLSIIFRVRHAKTSSASEIVEEEIDESFTRHTNRQETSTNDARLKTGLSLSQSTQHHSNTSFDWAIDSEEPVWKLRQSVVNEKSIEQRGNTTNSMRTVKPNTETSNRYLPTERASSNRASFDTTNRKMADEVSTMKTIIVEWQGIAVVADRTLFWLFFMMLLIANIMVLVVIPSTKSNNWKNS